jgi:hypothetical protein
LSGSAFFTAVIIISLEFRLQPLINNAGRTTAAGYRITLPDLSEAKAQAAGVTLAQILPVNALDLSPLSVPSSLSEKSL